MPNRRPITPPSTGISRRRLLQSSSLYSLAAAVPPLFLSACGGGSGDDDASGNPGGRPVAGARETVTMHFDLSHAPIAEPRLQLARSKSHGGALLTHSDASRAKHRGLNPALAGVPDAQLTHYLEGVDAPAGALQMGSVIGKHVKTGAPVFATSFLRVPTAVVARVAAKRAKTPLVDRQPKQRLQAARLLDATALPSIPDMHSGPRAIATWLVFQHPAITNLDPDLGGDIIDRIGNLPSAASPYLAELMFPIAELLGANNYPTTSDTGSWAILVPRIDPTTGSPAVDSQGNPICSLTVNPVLAPFVATVVKQILNNINSDTAFQGSNWQPSVGAPHQTPVAAAAASAVSRPGQVGASANFSVTHSLKVGSRTSGIRFNKIECADDRSVKLTVANEFLRSAGAFVQFFDGADQALPVSNPSNLDTARAKYITMISPDTQIMGIPFQGSTTPTTGLNFTMPDAAVKAVVYYGGLGLGGSDAFGGEALFGTLVTLVVNIGLPALCLTWGLVETAREGLAAVIVETLDDPVTLKLVATEFAKALGSGLGSSIQTATTTLSLQAALGGIAELVLDIFLQCCPRFSIMFAAFEAADSAMLALPIVGVALWALSAAADIATLGETVIECISCPAIDTNTISLTMSQSLSVSPDPNDYQFPATATHYKAVTTYDSAKTPLVVTGSIAKGTVGPFVVDMGAVASGGSVVAEISFYNDQNCLVGYGKNVPGPLPLAKPLVNLPATAATIPITIKEILVPLDATTTYQHSTKLVYQNGAHAWDNAAAAPTATVTSLQPGSDSVLAALYGITVHTATGMAGYSFAAGGQGIGLCYGTAASVSSLRGVFLGDNPDSAAKSMACGFTQPIGIVYALNSAVMNGNNFFLERGGDDYFYYVRQVNLDASGFDVGQNTSWGKFSNPLSSLCVLSGGYVVGVNVDTHKMEVLRLGQSAQSDSSATTAGTFSSIKSGWGSQQGQLDTPVAVCAYLGYALVLEQGNMRVQAFDQDGTAVNIFTDANGVANNTALMALKDGNDTSVNYIDIGVEGQGFIYVLSYANGGASPNDYHLDVYTPAGVWLSRSSGLAAGAIAVDLFRNVYALNYETIAGAPGVEPSLSQWLPHSTTPCAATASTTRTRSAASGVQIGACTAATA